MMADQIIKDRRNIRIGVIRTESNGNMIICDEMNRRLGVIKGDSQGVLTAYDSMNRRLGSYSPREDATKDTMNRRLGKGNMLQGFYFPSL